MTHDGFLLGFGREVAPRGRLQRLVYSMPLLGRRFEQAIWPPEYIWTDGTASPHIFVTAGSGAGKTLGLVLPWCQAALKRGSLVYFNGAGPGFDWFVRECVANELSPENICLIDPGHNLDLGTPWIDLLRPLPGRRLEQAAESLVADMMVMSQRLSQPGPRMNEVGYNIFRVLQLEGEGLPLAKLHTFLYNQLLRRAWISRCPDADLKAYWQYFEEHINPQQKAVILNPVSNKFAPLLRCPFTSPMFAATESSVHLDQLINTKGMGLAVNFYSDNIHKDVVETLAQLFFSHLKTCIIQRGAIRRDERVPLTVIVDEYSFIRSPAVMEDLYRLSRNLSVTILEESELRAIVGSSGCVFVMAVGQKESERLGLELAKPTGTKRKSWTELGYYSVYEEIYHMQELLSKEKQKQQQGVASLNPKGLYFLRTPTRTMPPEDVEKEEAFRLAVAQRWYRPLKQ